MAKKPVKMPVPAELGRKLRRTTVSIGGLVYEIQITVSLVPVAATKLSAVPTPDRLM
jgi:hypothetical protein